MFFPKQFTVRGSQFFLKMCPPFVSLLVSALFRWPCSISIHLSPRFVPAGVRPFPLAMLHFYSFVSQVCRCWCPLSLVVSQISLCLPSCWSLCPPCLPSCLPLSPVLSPFLWVIVSALGHRVRLVSLLFPFVSGLVSLLVDVSKSGLGNASLLSLSFVWGLRWCKIFTKRVGEAKHCRCLVTPHCLRSLARTTTRASHRVPRSRIGDREHTEAKSWVAKK